MKEIHIQKAITEDMVPQLNINRLIKGYYIKEDGYNDGTFESREGDPTLYVSFDCRGGKRIMNIKYEVINGDDWMDYEIKIVAVPSNLGKGVNLYFECVETGKLAKILYYCIKTHRYVSRAGYPQRIYYSTESKSKLSRLWDQYGNNEKKLVDNFIKMRRNNYGGQPTKINGKIGKLLENQNILSHLINRWYSQMK